MKLYYEVSPEARRKGLDHEGNWLFLKLAVLAKIRLDPTVSELDAVLTVNGERGVTLYLDGEKVGSLAAKGDPDFAPNADLLIGRNHKPLTFPA